MEGNFLPIGDQMKRIPCKKEDFIQLMADEKIVVEFLKRSSGLHQFSFPKEVTTEQVTAALRKFNFCDWGVTPHELTGYYREPGTVSVNLQARFEN